MDVDHYAEAERLLAEAAAHRTDDPPLAEQLVAEAQVHAALAAVIDPNAGCGDEPLLDWNDLTVAAVEAWPNGGMPLLPELVAFATALGLVVVERKPDAHPDPA